MPCMLYLLVFCDFRKGIKNKDSIRIMDIYRNLTPSPKPKPHMQCNSKFCTEGSVFHTSLSHIVKKKMNLKSNKGVLHVTKVEPIACLYKSLLWLETCLQSLHSLIKRVWLNLDYYRNKMFMMKENGRKYFIICLLSISTENQEL